MEISFLAFLATAACESDNAVEYAGCNQIRGKGSYLTYSLLNIGADRL